MSRLRRVALATVAGALALTGVTGQVGLPGAQAEPPPAPASEGLYIVQLAGTPVAARAGKRIDPAGAAARSYRRQLANVRESVLAKVPGAEKVYDYDTAFNGFAARLTGAEVARLRQTAGVVKVWKNEPYQVDTISTPAFLGLTGQNGVWERQFHGDEHAGEGVIVGMIDTGFWPENPAFAALPEPRPDADAIAAKWHGSCDRGADTPENNVTCNNKVIGARYFRASTAPVENDFESPRDFVGHGSHTASTAAGNAGVDVVINGVDRGQASGMAPAARLAIYKPCWGEDCAPVDVVAAVDQAVADGVDVINYSVAGSRTSVVDPVEIAFYNAARAGVFVATSAGNNGPAASSVAHNSPWVTTVASGTHDRAFRATATLGNGVVLTGAGLGAAVAQTDLVLSDNAGVAGAPANEVQQCFPGRLDPAKVTGKIVACARGGTDKVAKSRAVQQAGGAGMIHYNTSTAADDITSDFHYVPTVHVKAADAAALRAHAGSAGAKAALGKGVQYAAQAPAVGSTSSAGPALAGGGDLLKPDIMAPGVDVVAAVAPPSFGGANFAAATGTSMSTPHVAGLAALVVGKHPDWSPMWVKSALMTTASQVDNQGQPIRRGSANATPFDFGAGHVTPAKAFEVGLAYAATARDWLSYLCALGQGQLIGQDCSGVPAIDPSDLNYPSIAVGDLVGTQTVHRRLYNTLDKELRYTSSVVAPAGTTVTVTPSSVVVPAGGSVAVQIKIVRTTATYGSYSFGSLTWSDTLGHSVRSPIAVRTVPVSAPATASGSGASGSLAFTMKTGYAGVLNASVSGLAADAITDLPLANPTGGGFDPAHPATSEHVGKVSVTVPSGSTHARFATFDADYASLGPGTDVDLYAYRKTASGGLEPAATSATATAEESVTLTEPGEYEVYLDLFALPSGVTSATVEHHSWVLGAAAGNLTARPASQPASVGGSASVTASWTGLRSGTRYLGALLYSDGTTEVARTLLSITG